jgi:hypothetical protein
MNNRQSELSHEDLIRNENKELLQNKPVVAVITDDHLSHFHEHGSLLASIRFEDVSKQQVVENIKRHMEEHVTFAKQLFKQEQERSH